MRRRDSIERRTKMKSFWMSAAIIWIVAVDLQANATFDATMSDRCQSRNLSVAVDDFMRLFIDGREITNLILYANNWQYPDTVEFPCNTRVVAIEANNTYEVGAILASTDDGYVKTNTSWKCTNTRIQGWETVDFNDSSWKNAVVVPYHDSFPEASANIIRADARWIWTQGYEGQDPNVFCRIRIDVDECSFGEPINECDPSMGRCINIPSSGYSCSCYTGYTNDGQHKCKDVDECSFGQPINECDASMGRCINIPSGGYNCSCYPGYTNDGQHKCKDDNECVKGTHNCSDECLNTNGSYECGCSKGHRLKLDNQTCDAPDVTIEVTGKVPLTALASLLSLLLLAVIVPIIVVQRRRRMMKQDCRVPDEVPAAADNATYESLELPDVNGGKNHIYEPVRKTAHAENATYEGLERSNADGVDSDAYESLRKQ